MKLAKDIQLHSGTIIKAGTHLQFDDRGDGIYAGEQISVYNIPSHAIDRGVFASTESLASIESNAIPFDLLKPNDRGYDASGNAMTVIDKAKGQTGLRFLASQYQIKSFEGVALSGTEGLANVKPTDQFVVISNENGETSLSRYQSNAAIALESVDHTKKPFKQIEVNATVQFDDRLWQVIAKGNGMASYKTWMELHNLSDGEQALMMDDDKDYQLLLLRRTTDDNQVLVRAAMYDDVKTV